MADASPRLGQILVHFRVITPEQLSDALRNQVVYGGRLGTNLIEMGFATPDQIAHSLARQLGVPATLSKHFQGSDPALREQVGAALVAKYIAFPVARTRGDTPQVVVCLRDPGNEEAVSAFRSALGCAVLPAVAAELALLHWLEQGFGLKRPQRYAKSSRPQQAAVPRTQSETIDSVDIDVDDDAFDVEKNVFNNQTLTGSIQLVGLDQVERGEVAATSTKKQITLREMAGESSAEPAEAVSKTAVLALKDLQQEASKPEVLSLDDAIARITGSQDRAEVSDAVIAFLRSIFGGALFTIVKQDMVLGYRGFGGTFDDESVESVVVPLSVPTIFSMVHESQKPYFGPPPEGQHPLQARFFKLFPGEETSVAVVPIILRGRMVCALYGHPANGKALDDASKDMLLKISQATEQAFLRLIRRAKTVQS